jgi:4-hydroxybenzoate polyprenyltransferase
MTSSATVPTAPNWQAGGFEGAAHASDIDALLVRHPMAQGLISLPAGLAWAIGWGIVAALGAYWLNPVCLLIFGAGCLLEAIYCLLWRVSPYRALVSGAVKSAGAIAAVFAVDPAPVGRLSAVSVPGDLLLGNRRTERPQ